MQTLHSATYEKKTHAGSPLVDFSTLKMEEIVPHTRKKHAGSPVADFSTMKMEAIRSSETSVDAKSTQRHIREKNSRWFTARRFFYPEDGGDSATYEKKTHAGSPLVDFSTLKMEEIRRLTQDLHSATSQKTTFFIVTAVKASNHTRV
jgi:hypothetical protein